MKNSSIPIQRYKRLLSCTHSLYRLMNSTFVLRDLILRLAKLICQTFNTESCCVILLGPSKKIANVRCQMIPHKKYIMQEKIKITAKHEKRLIKTSSILLEKDSLAVPLIADDIIGTISVQGINKSQPFNQWDQDILMTIAQQAVIGIKNIQLYEEQQKIILGSIKSMSTLLSKRIPQEYTHSPYFAQLVCAIAEGMHLSETEIKSLKYASLLHDAGKIDIPRKILKKTSKLTADEFKVVKLHPSRAVEIIKSLQILKPAIPIILYHHERYDGTGYPSRLKKNQIPIGARIMAVADAFEAMVYGRPYRERVDIQDAIREIKKKSQTQFDPKVIEVFLKTIKTSKVKKILAKI